MKKILLCLLCLLMFSDVVFAAAPSATTTVAKAPEVFPEENETIRAVLDNPFDFSKISFSSSTGTSDIVGHSYMKKIMLTMSPNINGLTKEEILGDSWFTVYCLDGELKFPMYSYINFVFGNNTPDTLKMQQVITFKLFNDGAYRNAFLKAKGLIVDPSVSYELADGESDASAFEKVNLGTSIVVKVKGLTYTDLETANSVNITAAELTGNEGDTEVSITLNKSDMMFDKYYAKLLDSNDYNHALWIIEHSYPTHDLRTSLILADASYTNLLEEIKALHEGETFSDEELEKLVGDYVYSTVQYAIWYANNGIDVNGNKLGGVLKGSSELNKLYQYLIKDRSEYKDYSKKQFSDTLDINKPSSDKEIFKETTDYYIYGPFSIKYDLVSLDRVDVSIEGYEEEKAIIVDENETVLTTIKPDDNFYIKVAKSAKIANLTINASTQNALTFFPSTNRGKIYTAYYPLVQNVVSGGKIVETNISKSVDVVFNPKTGSEDIAILFVLSLVAFSLAYIVLSLKNRPVKL